MIQWLLDEPGPRSVFIFQKNREFYIDLYRTIPIGVVYPNLTFRSFGNYAINFIATLPPLLADPASNLDETETNKILLSKMSKEKDPFECMRFHENCRVSWVFHLSSMNWWYFMLTLRLRQMAATALALVENQLLPSRVPKQHLPANRIWLWRMKNNENTLPI